MKLWESIHPSTIPSVPFLAGRLATEDDVKTGSAVFYQQRAAGDDFYPFSMKLPACALCSNGTAEPIPVIIIQAEVGGGRVLIGARPLTGGNLLCLLSDCTVVEPSHPAFAGRSAASSEGE